MPVRAEPDAVDAPLVPVQGGDSTFLSGVPQFDAGVGAARRQELPVRMEVDGFDAVLVTVHGADQFSRLQVPHFKASGPRTGTDQLLQLVELNALDGGGVAAQAHETCCLADGPQVHLLVVAPCYHYTARFVAQSQTVHVGIVGHKFVCNFFFF